MFWKKKGEADGNWIGPAQVLAQEADRVVWVSHGTKLFRIAPEHVRYLSASEEWKQRSESSATSVPVVSSHGGTQFQNLIPDHPQNQSSESQNAGNPSTTTPVIPGEINIPVDQGNQGQTNPENEPSNSSEQPDQEPDAPDTGSQYTNFQWSRNCTIAREHSGP